MQTMDLDQENKLLEIETLKLREMAEIITRAADEKRAQYQQK